MALSITFSEPATVNTAGAFLAAGAVYDSGHGNWVYLGFRSPTSASSCQTSPDRTTWTMRSMPSAATWRAIDYASTLGAAGRLVAVGNGVAAWSDDGGATWSAATSLPEANNWIDVKWWSAKSIFVAVAGNGTNRVMTSADGKTWTARAAASALVWSGVAVSGTTAVAVAFATVTGTQLVMTSTDGTTWTLQTHTSITTNRGIVSSGSRLGIGYSSTLDQFLITGNDGTNGTRAWRSTNSGVTWTASNAIPTIGDTTNRGYFWLTAAGSWYMSCANYNYVESTDGITWTRTALPTTNSGYTPVGWYDSGGIILGGTTLGFDNVIVGAVALSPGISPATGLTFGGLAVTISNGSGFAAGNTVSFGTYYGSIVPATNVVIVSATTITCTTPAFLPAGIVSVFVETAAGVTVLVLLNAFTYITPATSGGGPGSFTMSPNNGPMAGGTVVTLTANGFLFGAAPRVQFDTFFATAVSGGGTGVLTCTTPAHIPAGVKVTIFDS